MTHKFRLKLIKMLQKWLLKLQAPLNDLEYRSRQEYIRLFFHEILPNIDEKWADKAIIESGKFNYFTLPSGELPKFEFALPEIPLYVVIGDIRSANWEQASARGVSREQWESYQHDLSYIEAVTPTLATIGLAASPKLLLIRWNDAINHFTIAEKLQDITI